MSDVETTAERLRTEDAQPRGQSERTPASFRGYVSKLGPPTIELPEAKARVIAQLICFWLAIFVAIAVFSEFIGRFWQPITIVVYIFILTFLIITTRAYSKNWKEQAKVYRLDMYFGMSIVTFVGMTLVFARASQLYSGKWRGFDGHNGSFPTWLRFSLNDGLYALLFGIPSAYAWQFTTLDPTSFGARTMVLAFRLLFQAFAIVSVVEASKLLLTHRRGGVVPIVPD